MIEIALAECKGRVLGLSGAIAKRGIPPPHTGIEDPGTQDRQSALLSNPQHTSAFPACSRVLAKSRGFATSDPARSFVFSDFGLALNLHSTSATDGLQTEPMTLKIQRSTEDGLVVFTLTGRIQVEHLPELQRLLALEARDHSIVFDLDQVRLV